MAAVRADVEVRLDRRSQARVESELNNMFRRMSGRNAGFAINEKSFTQPLGRITASANEFTKSLEASNARVIAFGASVGVINAVTDAFKGLVMETIQFEKTLSEINVIMNSSASALRNFGDELFNVARNTAQGFNVVAEAALEFSRQGLTMEETLRRTNDALILTRLTSLKATEAVSGLTAAVNAFGSAGLTTTEIIDKLAAVDVNFAVSSEDLIHALERTGAVAISAGVELDNLIGLVTALQQNTARGGSVIGNGLKTIFTRIQRPASLRQLEEMNIAVRDLTGAVLPADKILQNIAKTFDTLSQAQQSNLVQFSAGIFQANIFRATLADLSKQQNIFADASKISADAAGNAAVKNAALNKTLAAMVSQTSSSVKELAGALGEIMLEDDLKSWTKGFKSLVDGLTGALDSGEGKGSDFAKGFFKGLGNVLTGPVAIAIGVVFVKLLANVAKFAGQSLKDVLGVTSEKEKLLKMENGIIEALSRNKHIQQALNNLEGDRLAQEEFMLKVIEAQTNAMQAQKRLAQSLARPLMNRGISPDMTASNVPGGGRPVDLNGDGQYDTFTAGGLIPKAVMKERRGAIKGGYNPGAISTMNIDGVGNVIYNKAETVKRFPGFKQPAIMPPESSRAGKEYRGQFAKQHGFDPYASHGLVPNFASIQNNASNMRLMGTGQLKAPMYIERQIRGASVGEPMSLKISTKASGLKGKNWKRNQDGFSLGELLVALGIDSIDTTLPFDFVPGTLGPLRKLPKGIRNVLTDPNNDAKGDGTESIFLSSQAGEGYTSTGGITPLDSEGAYSVDRSKRAPNANLDAYKIGDIPIEVKAGDLDLNGVVKKSIRRYSNTSFRNSVRNSANDFLYDDRPNAVFPDMTNNEVAEEMIRTINHLQEEFIIERLSELAKNGNWSPVGMSREQLTSLIQTNKLREHLRNSGFSASDTDKELLNSIGFSAGFIPNFGRGRPSGSSKIDYEALADTIMKYPGSIPTYEDLAAETGFGIQTIAHLGAQGPNGTKKAFINYFMNKRDHYGSGARPYTRAKAEEILSDVSNELSLTRQTGYAQNLGLVFEQNLRDYLGVPKPAGEPHMDFPSKTLSGVNTKKANDIFLSTRTAGDAYKGQRGHPVPHFIAKYLREKLATKPGGRTYDLTSGIGQKLGVFATDPKASSESFNNMGGFADIVGIKDGSKTDEVIKGREKLSDVLHYAQGLKKPIKANFGEIVNPHKKFVEFNYLKDYVSAMVDAPASGGFIPNYKNFYQMFYGNDFKPAGITGGAQLGARENWGHHHDYILSEAQADAMLKDEFDRRAGRLAGSKNPGIAKQKLIDAGIANMYIRKYKMDDSDYAQFSSGIYSDSNATILSKILTGLPWTDGKSNKRSALGTKIMPLKLASIRTHTNAPFQGREAMTFPDVSISSLPPSVTWPVQKKLNENFMRYTGMEQETIEEYLDNKDFIKLLSTTAGDRAPEAIKAGRQGGIQGVKDFIDEMYAGYIPNFLTFKERKGGGSPIPVPDSPGLFSKEEVEELKAKGFQRNDSDGWFKADAVPLKYKSPTDLAPFGKAEPVAINYLNKLIRHDRSLYSIPNAQDDNADLDQLGQSLIDVQKNPAIIGYDSSQNKLQLIEGNHRVAALNKLNKDKLKTQKMYSGLAAYVAGVRLDDVSNIDFDVGLVNQRMPPRKVPKDVQKALRDPYRAPGQFVQGFWKPSEFGIPNFADFWDSPYFSNKPKTITDRNTGTYLKYRELTPDYAEISHAARGKKDIKGGAFRNFNTLMGKYDSVGSGMLTPQRAGFGPTSWAKIITMFPQIKQRIQTGLRTLGDFAIDDTEMDFESLVELKRKTNRFFKEIPDADTFLTNFGNSPFFDDAVSFQNLTTYKVKGKGDSAAGFKARGLVPNFASIRWNVDKATNKWALSGNQFDLDSFARYLQEVSLKDPKMVNPKSANKFAERVERLSAVMAKEREEVHKNTPIGFGRQGRKHYDQMAFVSERSRDVSTDGLFIKNLKNHVKQFNRHGALFAADRIGGYDSFVSGGLVPNFYNLNRRNLSDGDKMSDRQKLLMMWQNKMAEIKQLAKSGKPRAEIDPIISKKNAEANEIWGELQKLKQGSNYYIPNYVDLEKVRQLAIRGVGGEKANAQRILNNRSIKSKNMFHDIIIDSFLDNPNQDYPPGTSIVDHLIALGYDEKQIRSAAKNPKGYRRAAMGLIPNFSRSPLRDAINREKAAGVPESMIRLDRSSQLMGPQNPMGLAVINTRDEPGGVQQGINRSRAMGIDPKKHGLQVPNFSNRGIDDATLEILAERTVDAIGDKIDAALSSSSAVESAAKAVDSSLAKKFNLKDDAIENKTLAAGIQRQVSGQNVDQLSQDITQRNSAMLLQAENKLADLQKNAKGNDLQESKDIQDAKALVEQLKGLQDALGEHSKALSGDTAKFIQELKDKGVARPVGDKLDRNIIRKNAGPAIQDAIDKGSDKQSLTSAVDEARAKLSRDQEAWRQAKGGDKAKKLSQMQDSRAELLKLKKSQDAIEKETKAREGGLQRLFYFQSMISMANGFLQQMAETGEGTTKTIANLGIAASDTFAGFLQAKELGREAAEAMGVEGREGFTLNPFDRAGRKTAREKADQEAANRVAMGDGGFFEKLQFGGNLKERGFKGVRENFFGGIAQNIGEAGRGFKRMIPVAGQLYAGFTALDSGLKFVTKSLPGVTDAINKTLGTELSEGDGIMGLFKTQAEIAANNIEKLSKASDAASKALEAVVSSGKNQESISKLEALGARRTIKQDRELHKLKMEQLKGDNSLNDAIKNLTDSNIVGSVAARQISSQMDSMTSSGKSMEETLRNLNITLQRNIQLEAGKKMFDENLEENFDFFSPAAIGGGIAAGLTTLIGTLVGGTGVGIPLGAAIISGAGAVGAGVGEGIAYGTSEDHMIDGKLVESTERSLSELNDMVGAMRGRAFELHQGLNQGLYGGDTDAAGNIRSDEAKRASRDYNLMLIEKAKQVIEEGGDEDDAEEILKGLRGSKGMGEVSSVQLQQAIIDAIKSGGDMEDTLLGLGKGEAFAISHGLLGGMLQMGQKEKDALSEHEFRKQQAEANMKNLDIQKKILRSHQLMLNQQAHELEMRGKSLSLEHEIEKSKQALLEQHGLLLNSVSAETEARHASEAATQKHNEKMMSIRNAEETELMARVREYREGENMATRFSNNANYQVELNKHQKDLESKQMTPEERSALENKIKDMQRMGAGGQAIIDRQIVSRILAGETIKTEDSSRADRLIAEGFTSIDGPKTAVQMQGHNEEMIAQFFKDANLGSHGDAMKGAKEFFKNYASDIEGQVDARDAITTFIDSFKDVQESSVRTAIILMAEEVGMFAPSDAGAGLDKLQDFLSKSAKDREKAQKDFLNELAKNKEAFRSSSIDKNTMLGAAMLNRDIVENNKIGGLEELMNKNLEGEAATQEVRNRLSSERVDILLRSKNFELRTLAFLEKDLQATAEESIKSLKQSQIKNQIFKSNQSILTSSVSKVLLEKEELDIANKDKEIKLAMLNNSEYLVSASDSKVRSEILDAEITAKITEGKRKILENAGYSRMLAEAQSKTDLENARISEINARHKLIAQVSNQEISKLVKAELSSKLSSTRTEALKAAESALQLQLNKEQSKKLQKANELLEFSNKFTAMKNAEMAANRSSKDIRLLNQSDRQTKQFNMIASARSAVDMAAMTGNADDKAEAASQIADIERSVTGRSGALTMLAQKMAEVEVAASSLSADLAANLFDGVRSGFGTLLTDIATGAETAGEAWEKFGLGVAKQLLDRVMEHNIDKMMSNFTYAFTGVKNDPATQQRLLSTAMSKQTTAINKLTKALEARRNQLGREIRSGDEGEGAFPLSTIDPAKVSDIMDNLGGLKMSAGAAAEALDGLVIKAKGILSERDNKVPEAQKAHSAAVKKLEEHGGKELARKMDERDAIISRTAEMSKKNDRINENIEALQGQRSKLLEKGGGMKSGYSNEDMILAAYLKGADEEGGATHASTLNELAKMLEMQDMKKGITAADRPERKEYIRRAEGMLPEDDGEADGLAINSYYWKKGGVGEGLYKNTDTWDDDFDLQIEGIDNAREGRVIQDMRGGKNAPYIGDYADDGSTNLFKQGRVKEAYDDASSNEKLNNQVDSINQELARLKEAKAENLKSLFSMRSESDVNNEISALKRSLQPLEQEVNDTAEALRRLRVESERSVTSSQSHSVPTAKTVPAARPIQKFHDGGFVRGEPGRDKVPAMLTAGEYVIPKDMMQAFKEGGKAEESRVMAGLKGSAQAVTMALVAEEIRDELQKDPEDKPPTFDMKKLNTVDIGSDVNISRGDPRMSARALAKDPVMKEYKDYLLKKASYDVQKKNEKFQERMGMLGTVVGAINSFAISQATDLLKEPINNLVTKGDNFLRGTMKLGDHHEKFNDDSFPEGFNYRDINEKDKRFTVGTGKNKHKWVKDQWVPIKKAMGGQIPAMLTAGEMYVPAEMAKRIGYDSLDKINKSGIIDGPGGIDNVGPVGLNPGDFIIRKSSTDKLLNTNPNGMRDSLMGGGFTRRAATGYYEGGMAGETATVPVQSFSPRRSNFDTSVSSIADQEISSTQERTTSQGSSATTNNINVSVKIDSSGRETVESSAEGEGSYQREKDLSMKIKSAVLEVIRQEKRVGGELS